MVRTKVFVKWVQSSSLQWLSMLWWTVSLLAFSKLDVVGKSDGITISESDFQTLLAFKHALQDPHNVLKSWNGSALGACSGYWAGVKCLQGRVIALNLPRNGLGGHIADEVGQLLSLRKINLHTNFLEGEIPPSLALLPDLKGLYLFGNKLSGSLPGGFANSPFLRAIDLSRNRLSGAIPSPFTTSLRIYRVNLSFNNFTGRIPPSLLTLKYLRELRLNNNRLQGSIPQLGQLKNLSTLDISVNEMTGVIPANLIDLTSLISLNLAHNDLTGSIPANIERLQQLQAFDVSNNKFSGKVPSELGDITGLATLDLSKNSFTGGLPSSLAELKNLSIFNCSFNNLIGPAPSFSHKYNISSFIGNAGLCGYDKSVPCAPPLISPTQLFNQTRKAGRNGKRHKLSKLNLVLMIVGSVIVGILLICLMFLTFWQSGCMHSLLFLCCCRKPERSKSGEKTSQSSGREISEVGGRLVHFNGSLNFSADDLLCATAEVLGKSTYGTVYKATLDDGNQVAVKRLREGIVKSQRDFEAEVTHLGEIRHPNILALKAYYWGPKDEKLLVYDYMAGGSLAAFLHARGPDTPLDWERRIRIAVGSARGLVNLHDHQKIIHGNLTSSNILLDSQKNAKLSDFGLSRLMTTAANSTVIATMSALGYRAPELTKLKRATTKSDVYSFGIVLLELLTGKAPGETVSTEIGMDLPEWVTSVLKQEGTNEIFDLELMKVAAHSEELMNTLQIAMSCVNFSPSNRPEMAEVLHQLEDVRPDYRQKLSAVSSVTV
eukprot:c43128_g1_i1 orf=605-2923(-)